jgi:hypothetical protein
MAREIWQSYDGASTLYALIWRQSDGYIYDNTDSVFRYSPTALWNSGDVAHYSVPMTSYGDMHFATFPSVFAGTYYVQVRLRAGATPAADDILISQGQMVWDGIREISDYSLGVEMITNGGFTTDLSGWTFARQSGLVWIPSSEGWTWAAGEAVFVAPAGISYSSIYQTFAEDIFLAGRTFRVSYKLSNEHLDIGAAVFASFGTPGLADQILGTARIVDGTYTEDITLSADTSSAVGLYFSGIPTDYFNLDDFSVKELHFGQVTLDKIDATQSQVRSVETIPTATRNNIGRL